MFDVVDRTGEHAFVRCDNAASHVAWGKSGIGPCGGHDGHADTREKVDGGTQGRKHTDPSDQHRHNDEGQRPRERDADDR